MNGEKKTDENKNKHKLKLIEAVFKMVIEQ